MENKEDKMLEIIYIVEGKELKLYMSQSKWEALQKHGKEFNDEWDRKMFYGE